MLTRCAAEPSGMIGIFAVLLGKIEFALVGSCRVYIDGTAQLDFFLYCARRLREFREPGLKVRISVKKSTETNYVAIMRTEIQTFSEYPQNWNGTQIFIIPHSRTLFN